MSLLTISRKLNQGVQIGPDIRVVVTGVDRGGKVRLTIEAPREVAIFRDEIAPKRPTQPQEGPVAS